MVKVSGLLAQATCFSAYKSDRDMCDCDQSRSLAKATIESVFRRQSNTMMSRKENADEEVFATHEAV